MTAHPGVCLSIGELSDYWTAHVSPDDMERIEAHVFACSCVHAVAGRCRSSAAEHW